MAPAPNLDDKPQEQNESQDIDQTLPFPTLVEAKQMFATAKRYTDLNFRQLWDDCYAVYKRRRVMRHYEGISDPVIPESFTIIETLVAQIAGGDLDWHFTRTSEEQPENPEVLNGAVNYYTSSNQMGLVTQEWVREMLLYGTAILHTSWRDGKPFIENIPLRDFFVDPNARAMTLSGRPIARYAGHLYLASKNVLKNTMIYNSTEDKMVPKYKNLDDVGIFQPNDPSGWGKFMDKFYKDMFQGSPLGDDATHNQVLVCVLYDLDSGSVTEMGNFNQIIYQDNIQYQREEKTRNVSALDSDGNETEIPQVLDEIEPFMPYAVLRDYVDTSLFYGEGEMAVLLDRAEMLNDLEAMDTDNIAYQNTPMFQIDPQFADLAPEIETIPGAIYPIPKGALTPIPIPELANDLDTKKDRVMATMRSTTAADEAVQGISQNKGRTTATEVSTEIGQAQNRFSTKIKNIEQEGFAQLGSILYKMMQIFLPEATSVRVGTPLGTTFKTYDPWEFTGEWEPTVQLETTSQQKALEVGQKMNQLYQTLANSPVYDPIEVQRFIVQHVDPEMTDEQFNALLNQQPPGPTLEEQKLTADGQRAELAGLAVLYTYPGTTPFIRAQIETIFHMQPDPVHEEEEKHNAIKMGAEQADLMNPHSTADNKPEPASTALLNPPTPPTPPSGGGQ